MSEYELAEFLNFAIYIPPALAYIALLFIAADWGSRKIIGGFSAFILSLFFSPVVGLIAVYASRRKIRLTKCTYCNFGIDKTQTNTPYCPQCLKNKSGKRVGDYLKL